MLENSTQDTVQLTPDESAVLTEFQQAMRDLQQQAQGALRLIIRQRGLQGNWSLEGNTLVRQDGVA